MTKGLKTLKVPEDVWHEAKVQAAKQGISLCDYVTTALKLYQKKMETA